MELGAFSIRLTFTDVRKIRCALKERVVTLTTEAGGSNTGAASIALLDPDGNPVLIDHHR